MKNCEPKIYGYLKNGEPLTDDSAADAVVAAFDALKSGSARVIKAPDHTIHIKTSVTRLPKELQEAAQYR